MKIVGISGKAGAGKDFVGRLMRRYGYQNVGFAWALKMDAMNAGYTFDQVFRTKPPEVRRWLQEHGAGERVQNPFYWINRLSALIDILHAEGGIQQFVITDVRYRNEYAWVKHMGGKLIRLEHGDRPYPLAGTMAAHHDSETDLDHARNWDLIITNNVGTTTERLRDALYGAGIVDSR